MMIKVVTGYVPIPGHPRSAKRYGELGEQVFVPLIALGHKMQAYYEPLHMCWLHKYVDEHTTHMAADNPLKNTLAYHIVQHQKFAWMLKDAIHDQDPDMFVWIDYGIGHVPGVTVAVIDQFLKNIVPGDFAIPGCWRTENVLPMNDTFPNWRFCGGVLVVPRDQLYGLYRAIRKTVLKRLQQQQPITWEVNSLATAERNGLIKPRWYQADHNETMFTGYACSTFVQ